MNIEKILTLRNEMSVHNDSNGLFSEVFFKAQIEVDFHASQKNAKKLFYNRRTGKRFPGTVAKISRAKELLVSELRSRARAFGITEPYRGRLRTLLLLGFPAEKYYTAKLKENRKNGDCSNLSQIVEDSLQAAGIIEDDFWLCPITIDRVCTEKMMVYVELRREVSNEKTRSKKSSSKRNEEKS